VHLGRSFSRSPSSPLPIMVGAPKQGRAAGPRLYEGGARLYNLGQYESAVQSFDRLTRYPEPKPCCSTSPRRHRSPGPEHCSRAFACYETYLREDPQTSNRWRSSSGSTRCACASIAKEKARLAARQAQTPRVSQSRKQLGDAPNGYPAASRKSRPLRIDRGGCWLSAIVVEFLYWGPASNSMKQVRRVPAPAEFSLPGRLRRP